MGRTDGDLTAVPSHQRHSMVIVPMNTPGIEVIRPMKVMGFDGILILLDDLFAGNWNSILLSVFIIIINQTLLTGTQTWYSEMYEFP